MRTETSLLLVTSASLVVTGALLVVTRSTKHAEPRKRCMLVQRGLGTLGVGCVIGVAFAPSVFAANFSDSLSV